MSNGKLRGFSKKAVVIPGPAQEMIFRRDVEVEIQDPLSALRDPKLAKVRTQIWPTSTTTLRRRGGTGGVSEFLCVRLGRLVHGGGRRLRRTTDAVGKSVPHITRQSW